MIDAYIGGSNGMFGCAISCFDTDRDLIEIGKEMAEFMKSINATTNTASTVSINGTSAYKLSCEYSYGGQSVKEVSYNFKKDSTFYNVKFGTDVEAVNKNRTLIEHMISSFKNQIKKDSTYGTICVSLSRHIFSCIFESRLYTNRGMFFYPSRYCNDPISFSLHPLKSRVLRP